MTWRKRSWFPLILGLGFLLGIVVTHAQTGAPSVQYPAGDHTLCIVVPSTTAYCYPNDGMYQSIKGAAFSQVGIVAVTGVTSVTVCNAAGVSCGTAQTGAVSLSIPKTVTVSATLPTATLQ